MSYFKYIGTSFHKADLHLRESISLTDDESRRFILDIKELTGISEILVISTCNRTGVFYSHTENLTDIILFQLGMIKGVPELKEKKDIFLEINENLEAVSYLFRVSLGLDSQVIGDIQISNQFKKAYQMSADLESCGPFLHRLMHSVFFANKRVSLETEYRDGTASVSYAASELVSNFSSNFREPRVLIMGTGEIGADTARNLKSYGTLNITLSNRTQDTAEKLSGELGFNYLPYENALSSIEEYDIIVGAIQSNAPILMASTLKGKKFGLKFFIDLSVPRCFDKDLAHVPGVLLYNIDNIKSKTEETIQKRMASIPKVESIIQESLNEFAGWQQEMEFSPTINKLKSALEDIRKEEMSKYLKSMDDQQILLIENITKGMMQKIIKLPVMQLKAACKRGEAETLIDVLNDLFDLDKTAVKS